MKIWRFLFAIIYRKFSLFEAPNLLVLCLLKREDCTTDCVFVKDV